MKNNFIGTNSCGICSEIDFQLAICRSQAVNFDKSSDVDSKASLRIKTGKFSIKARF